MPSQPALDLTSAAHLAASLHTALQALATATPAPPPRLLLALQGAHEAHIQLRALARQVEP